MRNYWTLFSFVTIRLNFKDIEFPNEIRFVPIIKSFTRLNWIFKMDLLLWPTVSYFACKSLLIKRTVKRSARVSLSLLLTSIFWSIKFTFIFYFIPLIYSQYSRSRPLNNRCPENWFVTLYLHIHTYAFSLFLSLSMHPTWRRIHATICLAEPAPSTSSLRVTSCRMYPRISVSLFFTYCLR